MSDSNDYCIDNKMTIMVTRLKPTSPYFMWSVKNHAAQKWASYTPHVAM